MDLDVLERELCRIPEVTAVRVVAAPDGHIEEVHILSLPSKHAKQIVRDVQSVAMASFGVDLDRRVVSVVQLDAVTTSSLTANSTELEVDLDEVVDQADERIHAESVTALRHGLQCTATVVLRRSDELSTGTAEGLVATSSVLRLVAAATISALRQLESAAARTDIEMASITRLGERSVAVVTVVVVVPPYEEVIAGSAVVRAAGELDAITRAVLDATNRRLPQLR